MPLTMEYEMTAIQLRDIFATAEYKQDLEELSSYLASIMHERPIIHCLANTCGNVDTSFNWKLSSRIWLSITSELNSSSTTTGVEKSLNANGEVRR